MSFPSDIKDQIVVKSMVLGPRNLISSAALHVDANGHKKLWLLMERKDCKCLGALTTKIPALQPLIEKVDERHAKIIFPLLTCPQLALPKNLIDQQLTFGLLKPDLVERGLATDVIRRIEEKDLTVIAASTVTFTMEMAREFYGEHHSRPFFPELVEYMSSGPSLALIMMGKDGVKRWRDLMGPTDPAKAKKSSPRSLRAVYGMGTTKNSFHGSDSWESASREIVFACNNFKMEPHRLAPIY